jgi:hypothetical protein
MGYKASIITIKDPSTEITNEELLNKLGLSNFVYENDTTFDECMYPSDGSVSIGQFNNCLIICDDYQFTTTLEMTKNPEALSNYEKTLSEIFPACEILTTACHSVVNYHMYSLVVDGEKLRYKRVVDGDVVEYGDRIFEEEEIYASSKMIDGALMFNSRWDKEQLYDNTEDQLMEDFTFGVAKRHLGVMISSGEEEELDGVVFKKYVKRKAVQREVRSEQAQEKKRSWFSKLFGK